MSDKKPKTTIDSITLDFKYRNMNIQFTIHCGGNDFNTNLYVSGDDWKKLEDSNCFDSIDETCKKEVEKSLSGCDF